MEVKIPLALCRQAHRSPANSLGETLLSPKCDIRIFIFAINDASMLVYIYTEKSQLWSFSFWPSCEAHRLTSFF